MTDDFFQEISNTGNPFEYADNVRRYQTQLPLGISWPTMTGSLTPRDLYSDDNSIYMYYPSGLNKTAIEIQQRDRFGGVTFTLLSGSVNLFIQASEYFADPNPAFISAPYTLSGESGTDLILASYVEDTPNNPENYWINLPSPGTYKVVFPNPVVSTALTVTHSGSSPYIFSQMLPRKSVGGYDIDVNAIRAYHVSATLIDTIALQVADSIVVGPELIGAKSIDGSKIIDGTISGVLIRDGTVTGNKVLAGTISGVLLQGSTITGDKLVSNTITAVHIAFGTITGDKITAGTISGELITAGSITSNQIAVSGITAINMAANSITADNISVRTITAEKIVLSGITAELLGAEAVTAAALASGAVISGKIAADSIYASNIVGGQITAYHVAANTITGDKLNVNQLDAVAANMGTLIVNSGITVGTDGYITVPSGYIEAGKARLDSTGIHIGDVASSNLPSITDTLRIAGSGGSGNIVGMALYNGAFHATTPQAVLQLDATTALDIENNALNGITNFNFPASGVENSAAVNIYNANLQLRRTPNPPEPNITPGALIGYDSDDTLRYYLGWDELKLNNNTANTFKVNTYNGDIVTLGGLDAQGTISTIGPVYAEGNIATDSLLYAAKTGANYQFEVNGDGDINTKGGIFAGTSNNKFTVAAATGNTAIAGTLNAAGAIGFGTSNNKVTIAAATGNTAIAGTLGVTGAVTMNANVLQYNYGGIYKNTAQTINAGADARITFQVSYTNGDLDDLANHRLLITHAGFYVISAGVIGNFAHTWQVVTGGAFGSGQVMNGQVLSDHRAYVTKQVYLTAGTELELWVRNSGGNNLTVTTGATGTVLSAAKVG